MILNVRLRKALGGAGKGDAFLTISNAWLSSASWPLLSFTFAESTLPLPSILRSSITSPSQPRICAIFGYALCLAIARPNWPPYSPSALSTSAGLGSGGLGFSIGGAGTCTTSRGIASTFGSTAMTVGGVSVAAGGGVTSCLIGLGASTFLVIGLDKGFGLMTSFIGSGFGGSGMTTGAGGVGFCSSTLKISGSLLIPSNLKLGTKTARKRCNKIEAIIAQISVLSLMLAFLMAISKIATLKAKPLIIL